MAVYDATSAVIPLTQFIESRVDRNTLALVYGRRRVGKSTLLSRLAHERGGFYWEATRGETPIHLARLGEALGAYLGVGALALATWDDAIARLLALGSGERANTPIVLDEVGYLLEAAPELDSVIASLLGPARRRQGDGSRLILCGSAIAMMKRLIDGEAPLRGRAALELVMHPFDYRTAAARFKLDRDLTLAVRVFAVIDGVVGYATDMVDDDLPENLDDFGRWVVDRVLSPAATLHREAATLLAEDPTLSSMSPSLHHSILGVIANGAVTAGKIANELRRRVSNIAPFLSRLVDAGFVVRHEDPIRAQRPRYALADPFLQFHYAILERYGTLLRDRNLRETWETILVRDFDSRVRGPVFEEQARTWVRRYAAPDTLGGQPLFVGPSTVSVEGVEHEIDVVVAEGDHDPGTRRVVAIGEAKAGEALGVSHLARLDRMRAALGLTAVGARLLLFAPAFADDLRAESERRSDVELIDLERLYHGT